MARKVIGVGETVLDIIFKDDKPMEAVPGGSTFNAIISLGRCGISTSFVSETGNDRIGKRILDFLRQNGVDSQYVNVFPDSKSPLSLAFLNEENDAEYLFYKDHPHDRIDFVMPDVQEDDVILFGSFFALNPVIRPQVKAFLEHARHQGAILYYDVNFRASHKNDVMKITPNLLENLEYADIVRGSKDDFEVLYKKSDADKVYEAEIAFYCKNFIYTRSGLPVELRTGRNRKKSYPVVDVNPVSTIGAGDNFNAGFIYGLLKYGVTRAQIENGLAPEQWDQVIACAQEFSAECCKDIMNYISPEFGRKMALE